MQPNVDPAALAQFERLAARWWDPDGESRALHDLNPARLGYVMERVELRGKAVLDVGCGGGLLSEALAAQSAKVTGIDLAPAVLETARLHLYESGLQIEYLERSAEALAAECPQQFDVITCMEMLEHVPDPAAIVDACADLLKPGGWLFLSTLNRTPQAFALAIAGAEYVMHLLPKGTHRYAQFIRPSELASALRAAGLQLEDVSGMQYNPFTRAARVGGQTGINYLVAARKPS